MVRHFSAAISDKNSLSDWNVRQAIHCYGIAKWGKPYFSVNGEGNMVVQLPTHLGSPLHEVDLKQKVDAAIAMGIKPPFIIRFPDLIQDRVRRLNETFASVIEELNYEGKYRGVYPIKVNQTFEVVQAVVQAGTQYHYGLEAGSKAELLIVLAAPLSSEALIICNGYKDEDFLKAALIGSQTGKKVLVVIEKFSELPQILALSEALQIRPKIGIRCRLHTKGSGRWESSSGVHAKFGLSTSEIFTAVDFLRSHNMLDCFELLHFHIGSQVTTLSTIQEATQEAAYIYAHLMKLGAQVRYFDIGGGLAVDYDGSQSTAENSMNYDMKHYVFTVVQTLQNICQKENIPQPTIVSESGRSVVAHHSVIIMNVFGSIQVGDTVIADDTSRSSNVFLVQFNSLLKEVYTSKNISHRIKKAMDPVEILEKANDLRTQALAAFNMGELCLEIKAQVEDIYWALAHALLQILESKPWQHKTSKKITDIKASLKKMLSFQYLCNFSLFQSLPDYWAIQNVFPVLPIHRLQEEPLLYASLADITCDSDGKMDAFLGLDWEKMEHSKTLSNALPVHNFSKNEPYYIGVFLTGAYQDVMGNYHNLFGKLQEVQISFDPNFMEHKMTHIHDGDSMRNVLAKMHYHMPSLLQAFKQQLESQVKQKLLSSRCAQRAIVFYKELFLKTSYLSFE